MNFKIIAPRGAWNPLWDAIEIVSQKKRAYFGAAYLQAYMKVAADEKWTVVL